MGWRRPGNAGTAAAVAQLVPFQLDPARGSAQRACDWLWGGLVENLVRIVGTALGEPCGNKMALIFAASSPIFAKLISAVSASIPAQPGNTRRLPSAIRSLACNCKEPQQFEGTSSFEETIGKRHAPAN